ncbi:MAG: AAA family ATPase [Pyrinomonadaceae bacterium]|nr:AAA family ATPase [Pyrinomonadaceae bacterium]
MYKDFFGLKEYPFGLTPDPKFVVFTPGNNELLAGLYYGIEMAKGLIVLTGEVGTGKTTALRWVIRRLDSSVSATYIFNPRLSIMDFYHKVTEMLEITSWTNKSDLLSKMGKTLEERHSLGLRTIIIVDEAHALSDDVLEEIRLLLNFESDNAKHLQIILSGQPELQTRLRQQNLRQLKQRVALRCSMPRLESIDEVHRYITERLKIAGSVSPNIFSREAIAFIFHCASGIPRIINNLCDNAMILAFSADTGLISRQMVESVAENLDMLPERECLQGFASSKSHTSSDVLTHQGKEDLLNASNRAEDIAFIKS